MTYSFAAQAWALTASRPGAPEQMPARWFALIDVAQSAGLDQHLRGLLPGAQRLRLFDGFFTEPALPLSPELIELSDETEVLSAQVAALDEACRHLPMLSLLRTTLTLEVLVHHLQSLLCIEADGTEYLLRFADSQLLAAISATLTPAQRARFFSGVAAWWIADHAGCVHDMAAFEQAQPAAELPLELDAQQTQALLAAAIVPTLASQLRALEPAFARTLSHAQQCAFVTSAVAAAREARIGDDALGDWLQLRWQGAAG